MATSRAIASQHRLLQIVADSIWIHGCQPSLRELAVEMGWSSIGYVQFLLSRLKEEGVIEDDHYARGLRFDWQSFVTDKALSRNQRRRSGVDTRRRVVAAKCRSRRGELGVVSK